MGEKVKVTVRASAAHEGVLTVQDAMRQVLDFFDLLSSEDSEIEWRLVKATTNSPLTIEGEAASTIDPTVNVSLLAQTSKYQIARGLRDLEKGDVPLDWDHRRLKKAREVFKRNLNGVSSTLIDFEGLEIFEVTPTFAEKAVRVLDHEPVSDLYMYPAAPREENGSVEGVLTALGLFRERPAIQIAESKSKRHVWCRLNDRLRAQFSDKAAFEDFWKNQRVIVRGKLHYSKTGELSYVVASDLRHLETRDVPASAIADRNFANGLPIAEYLDRFREGTLGE